MRELWRKIDGETEKADVKEEKVNGYQVLWKCFRIYIVSSSPRLPYEEQVEGVLLKKKKKKTDTKTSKVTDYVYVGQTARV